MRTIKIVLVWLIVIPLTLEFLLWKFDPLGIAYLADIGSILAKAQSDGAIYTLPAGKYAFRTFDMTILEDHTRRVPDTPSNARCVIVAIGDSVTIGHGVNDNETFVNLLAREFPDVRFINAGLNGYNSRAIMFMQQRWLSRADGFIYRVVDNDIERVTPSLIRAGMYSYSSAYILYALDIHPPGTMNLNQIPRSFVAEMKAIYRAAPTLFFVSDINVHAALTPHFEVNFIPDTQQFNSAADSHPNTAGHEELTRAMLPAVREAIASWCQ